VRGALEPNGIRIVGRSAETGGIENHAGEGFGAGEAALAGCGSVGGLEIGEGPVDSLAVLVVEKGEIGPDLTIFRNGVGIDGDLIAERVL
jgi:hypothetical protein